MKVLKNYFWNVSYQMLLILVPTITMPWISRTLGPTGVGINSYTASIVQYFLIAGDLGTALYANRQIAYVRDDKEKLSYTFWEIFWLRCITLLVALSAFLFFVFFERKFTVIYLVQGIAIVASFFDVSWLFMGMENFRITVIRNMVVKLVGLLAIVLFVNESSDTLLYIAIITTTNLLGNFTMIPYITKYVEFKKVDLINIFKHLKGAFILFLPAVAIQLYTVLNKTMVGVLVNTDASGFYFNTDGLIKIILSLVTATGAVMLPHISNAFANKDMVTVRKMLYKFFDFSLFMSLPIAAGVAAIALNFAPWFFTEAFKEVGQLMFLESPVIVFISLSTVIGVQYLLPTRQNKLYIWALMGGAILNIIINVPLIIQFKVYGAIFGTTMAEFCIVLLELVGIRKQISIKLLFKNFSKYFIGSFLMFMVVFPINIYWHIINGAAGFLILGVEILIGAVIYISMMFILKPTIISENLSLINLFLKKIKK
ncbi:oligosaccharide flippase family protein [Liquorilactobacillus satsumensis]|uniref:oligosaccharide flippase family protein n=1 Tax=Liquorilactobacillus satsumensis TaxID=259059 RepID=UPI0039EB1A85